LTCLLGRLRSFAFLVLLGSVAGVALWGSAFSIAEQGARAAGMATAYTSIADDGSAIYYNPAGFAFQSGTHMQADLLAVIGLFRYFPSSTPPGTSVPQNGYSGSVKPHFIPVGTMTASMQMSPKVTLAFGLYVPFGLSANFTNFNDGDPNTTKFVGRFAGTRAALQSYWFQPTVAYKLTPNQAISIGVALVHTHLIIEQSILNPLDDALTFGREAAHQIFPGLPKEEAARAIARLLPEGRSRVAGTSNSPGFAAGYMFKHAGSKTSIGLNFRSAVTHHLSGKASFAFGSVFPLAPFVASDLLQKAFPTQNIRGAFTTPANYGIGISNSKFWNSTISFDFRYQDFHRFASVPLNFSQTEATNPDVRTPAEKRLTFNFRDSFQTAVGFEKRLSARTEVRAGYMFDRTPVVDAAVGPLFPDADRHSFHFGATRKVKDKEFTLFYEAMKMVDRKTNVAANDYQWTNGEYRNFVHIVGAGLRFNLRDSASTTF
jgi:long-chain fatty acid transport protein